MRHTIIIIIAAILLALGCEVDPALQELADNRGIVTRIKVEGDESILDKYLYNATPTLDSVQLAVRIIQHYQPSDAWVIVGEMEAIRRYWDMDYPAEDHIFAIYVKMQQDSVLYFPDNILTGFEDAMARRSNQS